MTIPRSEPTIISPLCDKAPDQPIVIMLPLEKPHVVDAGDTGQGSG